MSILMVSSFFTGICAAGEWVEQWRQENKSWRVMHIGAQGAGGVEQLKEFVNGTLKPRGFNALVLEVNYSFKFKSHPELAGDGLDAEQAKELAKVSHENGIRLIPLFNCVGHQSWKGTTFALLREHPEFDETPHVGSDNEGIYCREWCVSHPGVNAIVFDLIDELIEAFDADAFHVGMDEVFLIGDQKCPRCGGKDKGRLFANAVNQLYRHIARDHGIEMMMWGDRLLDAQTMGYGKWESAENGTHTAADMIPPDIIICDWHYGERADYPSIRFFQQKGFRVLPATWNKPEAAVAMLTASRKCANDKLAGFMFTGWSVKPGELATVLDGGEGADKGGENTKGVAAAIAACMPSLTAMDNLGGISVIPEPVSIEAGAGSFEMKWTTTIYTEKGSEEAGEAGRYLAELFRPATGFGLAVVENEGEENKDAIVLTTKGADEGLGKEGYELTVTGDAVTIRAPEAAGLFYGVQTLRQLLPVQIQSRTMMPDMKWTIPCVRIKDKPRFQWRGSLLDSGRHFFGTDFVKRYIDLLAYHKMNVLHWHLTEDQGWRIEIKKYPKLTEVAAWRNTASDVLQGSDAKLKPTDEIYGGYYTQDDVRNIVAYAKSRHVLVVPEIELPGHSTAALAAYPELSCTGGPFEVKRTSGISRDVYCAGNEKTFEFLQDVLTEVMGLFDSPYIHIGGDECPKERWKACAKCQARMKGEGLKNEEELQLYFVKRIENFLRSSGRRLIGWDEILEAQDAGQSGERSEKIMSAQAIVQSWRGIQGGIMAAKMGNDVVMSPTEFCYLDYQHRTTGLQKAYSFEPVPAQLSEEEAKHILGGEGNVWTEHIRQQTIDSWVFPRLTALSEVFWSPKEGRAWEDFSERMKTQYLRYDTMGVDYFRGTERF